MRVPDDLGPRRPRGSNRGRILLIVVLVVLFLLVTSLRGIAGFWTDYLWYEALDREEVFVGVLGAQLTLVAAFTLVFFLLVFVNLTLADRLAPRFVPAGPDELMLERYRELMGRRAGLTRAAVALGLGVLFGASAGSEWQSFILFRHGQQFGSDDPQFGLDIGFYVFQLPFLSFVVEWLFVSLVIVGFIIAVAHYLNGGIRPQAPFQRVTPQVKTHLSVLLALAALVKAADYWLQRYELVYSGRGVIDGAGYADLNAKLPALDLLLYISVAACLLFLVNIWRRGWVLPVVALGLWAFAALVVGTAYPAFVQRFTVEPEESAKEAPYIERNIEATRVALGMVPDTDLEARPFAYDEQITADDLRANAATIRNLRLLDPSVVLQTFQRLQAGRGFYRFAGLDVDRYPISRGDGEAEMTMAVLGTRELNVGGIPVSSWEGQHTAYTHGYGLALAPTSEVTDNGEPEFLVRDLPVHVDEGVPVELDQPQLYVGEDLGGYALVGTRRDEIDYVDEQGQEVYRAYEGTGGVAASGTGLGGFARRAAFALRFGEIDPLISDFVTADSRVIYVRDVQERVEKVAPFFSFDADPYPVVVDGRVNYVVQGYATTSLYPYAQRAETDVLPVDSGLRHSFNYVRNSVVAVVDAYDGDVVLYVLDDSDPITRAYRQAFPSLFADREDLPEILENHLRYPDDLFRVQTTMWGRYHISDPTAFYSQTDGWEVAQDPGTAVPTGTSNLEAPPVTNTQGEEIIRREGRIPPYYLQMRLPGEDDEDFVSMRPFVRASRRDEQKLLTSFMVAKSDPDAYGQLVVYDLDEAINGPALVAASIFQDPVIATLLTQLNQQGSQAILGNLLLVPVEDSLLYVRPLYVKAAGDSPVPQLQSVILVLGERVVIDGTLEGALVKLFSDEDGEVVDADAVEAIEEIFGRSVEVGDPGDPGDPGDGEDPTLDELLAEVAALFAEAEEALAEGDLGGYQDKVEEAQQVFDDALDEAGVTVTTSTTVPPATAPTTAPADAPPTTAPTTATDETSPTTATAETSPTTSP